MRNISLGAVLCLVLGSAAGVCTFVTARHLQTNSSAPSDRTVRKVFRTYCTQHTIASLTPDERTARLVIRSGLRSSSLTPSGSTTRGRRSLFPPPQSVIHSDSDDDMLAGDSHSRQMRLRWTSSFNRTECVQAQFYMARCIRQGSDSDEKYLERQTDAVVGALDLDTTQMKKVMALRIGTAEAVKANTAMQNRRFHRKKFEDIDDLLHRILAITAVLGSPTDESTARTKVEMLHEDVIQDTEIGEIWVPQFNAYFDMAGIAEQEFKYHFARAVNGTRHPSMKETLSEELEERVYRFEKREDRKATRDEITELFLTISSEFAGRAIRKRTKDGTYLLKDERDEIYREKGERKPRAAKKPSTAAPVQQAEWDEMKKNVKQSGVKAATMAAKEAVAAAMQKYAASEEEEEATHMHSESEEDEHDTETVAGVSTSSSDEKAWKKRREQFERDTTAWMKNKDQQDAARDKEMAQVNNSLATMKVEIQSSHDAITGKLDALLAAKSPGTKKPFDPATAKCRRCKQLGHGAPKCPHSEEEAAKLKEELFGNQTTPQHNCAVITAITHLLTCVLQSKTLPCASLRNEAVSYSSQTGIHMSTKESPEHELWQKTKQTEASTQTEKSTEVITHAQEGKINNNHMHCVVTKTDQSTNTPPGTICAISNRTETSTIEPNPAPRLKSQTPTVNPNPAPRLDSHRNNAYLTPNENQYENQDDEMTRCVDTAEQSQDRPGAEDGRDQAKALWHDTNQPTSTMWQEHCGQSTEHTYSKTGDNHTDKCNDKTCTGEVKQAVQMVSSNGTASMECIQATELWQDAEQPTPTMWQACQQNAASISPDYKETAAKIWQEAMEAMKKGALPSAIRKQAQRAIEFTAKCWDFRASDAIEAVMIKIENRTPLTFKHAQLGKLLTPWRSEIEKQIWKQAKVKAKKEHGSSAYIHKVTSKYADTQQAMEAWETHYQTRKIRGCTMRNEAVDQTIRGTAQELEELRTEMTSSTMTDTVMDEAGDTWYGMMCYTVAWVEQTTHTVQQWKKHMKEAKAWQAKQDTEAQTCNEEDECTTPKKTEDVKLNEISTKLEQVIAMAESKWNYEAIAAEVRRQAGELAAMSGTGAGALMALANCMHQHMYVDTIASKETNTKEEASWRTKQQIATWPNASYSSAMNSTQTWEQGRDECMDMISKRAEHRCKQLTHDKATITEHIVKAVRRVQRAIQGTTQRGMKAKLTTMKEVHEQVARLIIVSLTSCHESEETEGDTAPTTPAHIRFAASATGEDEWKECIAVETKFKNIRRKMRSKRESAHQQWSSMILQQLQQEEEWHDCDEQDIDMASSSEEEGESENETDKETKEEEQPISVSQMVRKQRERNQRSEGEVCAGVAAERREAEKRRQKPLKDMIDVIKKARAPGRTKRTAASRILARMQEVNKTAKQMTHIFKQARTKKRKEIRVRMRKSSNVETLTAIRRWQLKIRADKRADTVATIRRFHSVLVQVEIKQQEGWKTVIAIADTGSGPTIFRMMDVKTAIEEYGLEETPGLITADGNPLRGLKGKAAVTIRFKGNEMEHDITAHVLDKKNVTPILGMDFWKPHNAVFNIASNTISLETTMDDGSSVVEDIECWCESRESKDQIGHVDSIKQLKQAEAWATQQCVVAMTQGQAEASTVSQRQLKEIKEERRATQQQAEQDKIKRAMSRCDVQTVCRAVEDMYIPAGERMENAITAILDEAGNKLHCNMLLSVEGITKMGETETAEDFEMDEQELHSHHDSHEGEASDRQGETRQNELTAVPPMLVHPQMSQNTSAFIQVAVSNEKGTGPLIIRKGEAIAKVTQVQAADIKHQQKANINIETVLRQVSAATPEPPQTKESEKDKQEAARLKHKAEIWKAIGNKTGEQIVKLVKDGEQIGDMTFEDWCKEVGDHLKFGPRCTQQKKIDMTCLLYALRMVVAKDPKKPGVMKGVEGIIELVDPNVTPVKCKHRRYSPQEKETIRKETQQLLDNGMIEYSTSPWSAPVVLVKKKDGQWRFCVNFTATINPLLKHDAQPLPKSQDVLDNLAQAVEMSLWDVCSGYWHIELREQDRKYTAFSTDSHGLCQWKRLPFGMGTSGSQFVRSIEKVLQKDHPETVPEGIDEATQKPHQPQPILHHTVEMFVDDGTIHTKEGQSHINEVARCLKQLLWHDITIKMAKCVWCTDEANLIGHVVKCGQGVFADKDKINDLLAIKRLDTIGDLKAFLGSCVYLNRFIKDFALITAPLYALEASYKTKTTRIRHEGDTCNWTKAHEQAFRTMKAALATAPCLAFPDWSRPFIIAHDCSKYQMGGCLMQLDKNGKERIIAFTSKRLTPAQVKYGVTSKEGASLIHCVRKWRAYIHGHPCVVITDHKALTSLMTKTDFDTDRLNRMSAELMEYDLHIVHRAGRCLSTPDLMSRAIIETDPQKREKMVNDLLQWRARQEIKAEQTREEDEKILKRIKPDDRVGEQVMVGDSPPHLKSPAEAAMLDEKDPEEAYDKDRLARHIEKLVQGAHVDMEEVESCETVKEKVQQITEQMENGEYTPDSDYENSEDDEDPRIIEMYDMACAAVGWETTATQGLPTMQQIAQAQEDDEYTAHVKRAIWNHTQGIPQSDEDEQWATDHQSNYAIHQGMLKKAWVKGKGRTAETKWQIVVPKQLQAQVIRAFHSNLRNAHYGELKTFAQLREHFIWNSAFSDVHKFVLACEICQRYGNRPKKGHRTGHLVSSTPGEHWVLYVVHCPKAKSNHEYILTMIDVCSRWAIARPLTASEFKNEEIARIVEEEISKVGVHIRPKLITHDGGSEFKKRFEDVCHLVKKRRHISMGDRPEGHGIIERFNRELMLLVAKMCVSGKADKTWSWVVSTAVEAHNSAIHAPMAVGSIGVTPGEAMHGCSPNVQSEFDEDHTQKSITNADPGSRIHLEAIAHARKQAIEYIQASKTAYEQRLQHDIRNALRHSKVFERGDIVRKGMSESELKAVGKKRMKLTPANSEEMVIIESLGFSRYSIQKLNDEEAPIIETSNDLLRKVKSPSEEKRKQAKEQAHRTAESLIEYEVEEIQGERGSVVEGTKQFKVKFKDYSKTYWIPAKDVDKNCRPWIEYKERKRTGTHTTAAVINVTADLLATNAERLISRICSEAGVKESDILFAYAGIPCETYSIAGRTNKGRITKERPHGCNYRKNDPDRNPCCEINKNCPYALKARLHDAIAKHVQKAFAAAHKRGNRIDFGIENPDGDLKHRPFMQLEAWPKQLKQRVFYRPFDCCAYGHPAKKPMSFWTTMGDYQPEGNTGNGRCNNGQCGKGQINPLTGAFNHEIKIARQPQDGFTGKGATRQKNAMPEKWMREVLQHAMSRNPGKKIVLDLCSGWQSMRPVCEQLGLEYIAVDVEGDRNVRKAMKTVIAATTMETDKHPTDDSGYTDEEGE